MQDPRREAPYRSPGPDARTFDTERPKWKGGPSDVVQDPITPGIQWIGGPQGGARVQGLERCHTGATLNNGGDIEKAARNLEYRACTLQAIKASYAAMEKSAGSNFQLSDIFARIAPSRPPPKSDPNWKNPLEAAEGDVAAMRDITLHDLQQMNLRMTSNEVLCSAPEKWGVATMVLDLLTCPWIFPWCSSILPHCPSSRKFYFLALGESFSFTVPGFPGRTMGKAEFFAFIFESLLPAFPDFSLNARILTTTGLDDLCHLQIQATGTHIGAPFSLCGLPAIPPSGRRVGLSIDFLRAKVVDMQILGLESDTPNDPQCFPTGVYLQLGGTLPGF